MSRCVRCKAIINPILMVFYFGELWKCFGWCHGWLQTAKINYTHVILKGIKFTAGASTFWKTLWVTYHFYRLFFSLAQLSGVLAHFLEFGCLYVTNFLVIPFTMQMIQFSLHILFFWGNAAWRPIVGWCWRFWKNTRLFSIAKYLLYITDSVQDSRCVKLDIRQRIFPMLVRVETRFKGFGSPQCARVMTDSVQVCSA